jgi:flagellar motility protein MotE (MotC chaperone)
MKIRFLPILLVISFIFLILKINIISGNKYIIENKLSIANISEAAEEAPKTSETNTNAKDKDPNISTQKPEEFTCNKSQFNEVELDILKNLAKRREELEQWREEIAQKETILKAAEIKAEKKIAELTDLKNEVNDLLKSYNDKEDLKISSLVQIYENMKPKDAAKIFESLDMDILLQVIDRMNKSKTAPILAQMSPDIATNITIEFAHQKRLPDPVQP